MKILLADDHSFIRLGLVQILKDEFHDVSITEVSDGVALLKEVMKGSWDLVISDLDMPKAKERRWFARWRWMVCRLALQDKRRMVRDQVRTHGSRQPKGCKGPKDYRRNKARFDGNFWSLNR